MCSFGAAQNIVCKELIAARVCANTRCAKAGLRKHASQPSLSLLMRTLPPRSIPLPYRSLYLGTRKGTGVSKGHSCLASCQPYLPLRPSFLSVSLSAPLARIFTSPLPPLSRLVCDAFFVPPALSLHIVESSTPEGLKAPSLFCLLVMLLLPIRTAVVHCSSYVRQTSLSQQASEHADM